MSHHLTLRVSDAELEFLNRLAREKGITRTAAARQLLLQQVALVEIEKAVATLFDSRLATITSQLEILSQKIDQAGSRDRDDLIKATNFLVKELKK